MGVGLYNFAILNTKISNVVFIGAIPMTAILGFVLLRERITFSKIVLVLLSALGVIIISVKDFSGNLTFGIGELAALFSALFISLGLVTRNKKLVSLNDQEIAILMLSFATVQFVIASIIFGEGLPLDGWNYWILLIVLFGGLLNASLSYLMNYGFHRVDAVMASNIISADVVAATFFAFLVFKEIPNMNELLGGILIIVSAILLHKYDGKLKI
jgi:drug/metabolite transporter (DMT)-like permease